MVILQNMSWGRVMAINDIQMQTDRKHVKKYVTTRGAKVAQFNLNGFILIFGKTNTVM